MVSEIGRSFDRVDPSDVHAARKLIWVAQD